MSDGFDMDAILPFSSSVKSFFRATLVDDGGVDWVWAGVS